MNDNIHIRHRQRMYNKYLNGGVDSFTDHELLEMVLYWSIPRKNTNEIAHRLLDKFGSLSGVFDADCAQLTQVDGIGEKSAVMLKTIPELWRRYGTDKYNKNRKIESIEQIGQFFVDTYRGKTKETVMLLMLDNNSKRIDCKTLFEGAVNSSDINPRKIAEVAFACNASKIVLAHNHPNGSIQPSDDDITVTRLLRRAFSMIDLFLMEHIIVAENEFLPLIGWLDRQNER